MSSNLFAFLFSPLPPASGSLVAAGYAKPTARNHFGRSVQCEKNYFILTGLPTPCKGGDGGGGALGPCAAIGLFGSRGLVARAGGLFPHALVFVAPDVFLLVGELLAALVTAIGVVGDLSIGACGEHALEVHLNGAGGRCYI